MPFVVNKIYYLILTLASCVLCGAGGLFVYRRGNKKAGNQVFFLLMVTLVLWSLFEFKAILASDLEDFENWILLINIPFFLLLALLLRFTAVISNSAVNRFTWAINIIYLPVIYLLFGFSYPNASIFPNLPFVIKCYSGVLISKGLAVTGFKILTSLYLVMCALILSRALKQELDSVDRTRIKVVFTGIFLPVLSAGIIGYLYRTSHFFDSRFIFYPLGLFPLVFIISALIISYAILKYGFFSIKLILNRMVYYTLITFIIACCYIVVSELIEDYLKLWFHSNSTIAGIAAALAVAAIFTPLSSRLESLIERLFFKDLQELSNQIKGLTGKILLSRSLENSLYYFGLFFLNQEGINCLSLSIRICEKKKIAGGSAESCLGCKKNKNIIPLFLSIEDSFFKKSFPNVKNVSRVAQKEFTQQLTNSKRDIYCSDIEFLRKQSIPRIDLEQDTVKSIIPLETGGVSVGTITFYHCSGTDISWIIQNRGSLFNVLASQIVFSSSHIGQHKGNINKKKKR